MIWTDEMNARFMELWKNTPVIEMARVFGCSKTAISKHASYMGLARSFYSNNSVAVGYTLPRPLRDAIAAEGRRKNMPPSGVLASILYEHYGIEKPAGFNPWGRNGGKRKNSSGRKPKKAVHVYGKPSMPFVNIGRD